MTYEKYLFLKKKRKKEKPHTHKLYKFFNNWNKGSYPTVTVWQSSGHFLIQIRFCWSGTWRLHALMHSVTFVIFTRVQIRPRLHILSDIKQIHMYIFWHLQYVLQSLVCCHTCGHRHKTTAGKQKKKLLQSPHLDRSFTLVACKFYQIKTS